MVLVSTVEELLAGAIQQVIAQRPAARRYLEEIERGDRPLPALLHLAEYIREQFQAGRCRLSVRMQTDLRAATVAQEREACLKFASNVRPIDEV